MVSKQRDQGADLTRPLLRHHVCFLVLAASILAVTWRLVFNLALYSLHDQSSSHILLIPFIAIFLIFMTRETVFSKSNWSLPGGLAMIACGLGGYFWCNSQGLVQGGWNFTGSATAEVVVWIGVFLLCYGFDALRAALFPLLFLFLMVPWPQPVLSRVIYLLQEGSTEIALLLFKAVGVPVLRNGFLLSVPGVTIEVAQECSSIRSSVALFITCLLAARYTLRATWRVLTFVVLALLFSVVKNGIRIATLTLLSIYVNPSFLYGSLHRDGGILFFILALMMLWPVLVYLQRSEVSDHSRLSAPIPQIAQN